MSDVGGTDDIGMAVDVFDEHRRRIFGIAYRMLGTVADAEDIVQETWIRWQGADRSDIREPGAFLATVATLGYAGLLMAPMLVTMAVTGSLSGPIASRLGAKAQVVSSRSSVE